MRASLIILMAVCLAAPARAWEAKASGVEERLRRLPSPSDALQPTKPGWANRIDRPGDKVHWSETYQGRTYTFGVGLARGIDGAALRLAAAQERARASLIDRAGDVSEETVTLSDGRRITIKTGVINGARLVDWYLDREGGLYALAVLVQ